MAVQNSSYRFMAVQNSSLVYDASVAPRRWLLGVVLFFFAMGTVHAERVVRVIDGDSIVVASGGREVEVRIADMDAPELRQAYGEEAKNALLNLVAGRQVRLELVGGDAYRRIVANVFVDGQDVAVELVERGFAWVRRAYAPASRLISLEDNARIAHRGLWSDPEPMPPWIWRKTGKESASGESSQAPPRITPECGRKTLCREMISCDEAIAYLHECDLKTIDGDADGIPCESLCKYYR